MTGAILAPVMANQPDPPEGRNVGRRKKGGSDLTLRDKMTAVAYFQETDALIRVGYIVPKNTMWETAIINEEPLDS